MYKEMFYAEAFYTYTANLGLMFHMCWLMSEERALTGEAFPTHIAYIGFLSSMGLLM